MNKIITVLFIISLIGLIVVTIELDKASCKAENWKRRWEKDTEQMANEIVKILTIEKAISSLKEQHFQNTNAWKEKWDKETRSLSEVMKKAEDRLKEVTYERGTADSALKELEEKLKDIEMKKLEIETQRIQGQ